LCTQFLSISLGLLCRLIRIFADLGDALADRLDVDDETLLVGRSHDPPIRQGRPSEAACEKGTDEKNSRHHHSIPFALLPELVALAPRFPQLSNIFGRLLEAKHGQIRVTRNRSKLTRNKIYPVVVSVVDIQHEHAGAFAFSFCHVADQ